jgi:hypothetical protein
VKHSNTLGLVIRSVAVLAACPLHLRTLAETPLTVMLADIDSGTTSPQGLYRWMDVADQVYDVDDTDGYSYQTDYNYTQATVQVDYFTDAETLHGNLTAGNLKPHFAYQFKLVGIAGTEANERIGLTGRWWQKEWNGSQWANGRNLNNNGDGSWPNPNDLVYCARRDIPDPTSPTGRHYQYTAYLVFDYFITDEHGGASLSFAADSSYHVLWKTSQRDHTADDGPLETTTFDVELPDPVSAYDMDYPEVTVSIFGEWERLPVGGVTLPPGDYQAEFILTEESFHGGGLAGGWAGAMGATVSFTLIPDPAALPGDLDGDTDVDLDDYVGLFDCLAGPATTPDPTCPATLQDCLNAFDLDNDNDVDLFDFAGFTLSLIGRYHGAR